MYCGKDMDIVTMQVMVGKMGVYVVKCPIRVQEETICCRPCGLSDGPTKCRETGIAHVHSTGKADLPLHARIETPAMASDRHNEPESISAWPSVPVPARLPAPTAIRTALTLEAAKGGALNARPWASAWTAQR